MPIARAVRFGVFEVDLAQRELRRSGLRIRLQEQPFQLLAALLERPGEMVTREGLRSRLWPGDTFVDFDHSLNAAIKRLRDAFGESAETPIFVERSTSKLELLSAEDQLRSAVEMDIFRVGTDN